MRVLVVEDERMAASALRKDLQDERYDVAVECVREGAVFHATTDAFDLILLDLGLHDRRGLEILTAIRSRSIRIPVIVMAERDAVEDRISGLDAGADGYLTKPVALTELLARIRSVVRRGSERASLCLTAGALSIDLVRRSATCAGLPIALTRRELSLLEHLIRAEGEVVSRDTLAREVWKKPDRTSALDNAIDVHMARLRRKIGATSTAGMIRTLRGVGFMLCEKDS